MKTWMVFGALLGSLVSFGVMAEPMAYGQGAQSCGAFVTASEASRLGDQTSVYPFMVWTSGFVTAKSADSGIDFFKGTDNKSIQIWLENYCRANPLEQYTSAVLSLIAALTKKQN